MEPGKDKDATKITFYRLKMKKKSDEATTLPVAEKLVVAKGKRNADDKKKFDVGEAIEGGLKSSAFAKIGEDGVDVRIKTDDDNKTITQILIVEPKK